MQVDSRMPSHEFVEKLRERAIDEKESPIFIDHLDRLMQIIRDARSIWGIQYG